MTTTHLKESKHYMARIEICRAGEMYPGDRVFCRRDLGHADGRHTAFLPNGQLLHWYDTPHGALFMAVTDEAAGPQDDDSGIEQYVEDYENRVRVPDTFLVFCQCCGGETPEEHAECTDSGWVCHMCVGKSLLNDR